MPLSGSVRVIADRAGGGRGGGDDEGFAVLFPPGPPVPGIALAADEVAFDISGGPSTLDASGWATPARWTPPAGSRSSCPPG